jgi:hypothetical protein
VLLKRYRNDPAAAVRLAVSFVGLVVMPRALDPCAWTVGSGRRMKPTARRPQIERRRVWGDCQDVMVTAGDRMGYKCLIVVLSDDIRPDQLR